MKLAKKEGNVLSWNIVWFIINSWGAWEVGSCFLFFDCLKIPVSQRASEKHYNGMSVFNSSGGGLSRPPPPPPPTTHTAAIGNRRQSYYIWRLSPLTSASPKPVLIKQAVLCFIAQDEKMPQRLLKVSGNKYKGIFSFISTSEKIG